MKDQERAHSALHYLDPTCSHDEWIRAGMAAKSAGLDFNDFHNWSSAAGNYSGESECRNKWKSFSEDGPIKAGTLFAMASKQGWEDPKRTRAAPSRPVSEQRAAVAAPAVGAEAENSKASDIWRRCEPARSAHPYVAKKEGRPDGLRVYPAAASPLIIGRENVAGFLIVPCMNGENLQTLQFISPTGKKLNLPQSEFSDGFFAVGGDIAKANRIFIVEGIGQAWAVSNATGAAAVVCFGAGRMPKIARLLASKFASSRLVLVPDRGMEDRAREVAAAIACEWCELPCDKAKNYDVNDFSLEHGVTALAELLEKTKLPPMRFKLLSADNLCSMPPMSWMVRGILPRSGLAALYGPSGSGKSFLVLDIAASVAGGELEWFGRRVTQVPVTYCALEGEAGIGKRIEAWKKYRKKPVSETLRFLNEPFDLLNGRDVDDLAKAILREGGNGGLVILDTLNRGAPGADENSSVDMGNIIAASKRLQNLTGGLVLLVHHTGKDAAKGLRGHSSLYAALDGAIEVTKAESRRQWCVAKSKDDETGGVYAFRLEVVTVGTDDEGEEITSCVAVVDVQSDSGKREKAPAGSNQKITYKTLAEHLRSSKEFGKDGAPAGRPCILLEEAVAYVAECLACDAKHRTERAREAITALVAKNLYGLKSGWLWHN
jgi:putative DNA primase/helicase